MNRIAFISDIHGNLPALEAVLADIHCRSVEKIICLGDLVGYYSQVNEVIDIIRNMQIKSIMGNHDYALLYNNGIISRSKTCTTMLQAQRQYITSENFDFLKAMPNSLEIEFFDKMFLCVHGGINDYVDEYIDVQNEEVLLNYFAPLKNQYDYFISGHTHIPLVKNINNLVFCNSGSVGQPRDGNWRASYLLIDEKEITLERVAYNVDETKLAMQQRQFPDYISDVLYRGVQIGN
jgi:putative phosphoesterase